MPETQASLSASEAHQTQPYLSSGPVSSLSPHRLITREHSPLSYLAKVGGTLKGGGDHIITPSWVLYDVSCVETITLDPCWNPKARLITCQRYQLPDKNGLRLPWSRDRGHTYVNPPYSQLALWSAKTLKEWDCIRAFGKRAHLTLLVPSYTDTAWWHSLAPHANCVCFVERRVFEGVTFASALIYFGPSPDRFRSVFGKRGWVVESKVAYA